MRSSKSTRMARTLEKKLAMTEAAPRIDVVVARLTELSRSNARGLVAAGGVTLNGAPIDDPGMPVAVGDVVVARFETGRRYREPEKQHAARTSRAFTVVYEDDALIVIEKPAGVLTVATDRAERFTLEDELSRYLSRGPRITKPIHVVHRLDRDTSGLLVFGKTAPITRTIIDGFRARKPEREYAAILAGVLKLDTGTLESHLATAADLDQYSTDIEGEGKHAITHFTVEERLPDATVVRVRLETGRRNQIRVHFAEQGHPVLGDRRYAVARAAHPLWIEKRLALHARVLGFDHPVTGAPLKFTSPLPRAFEAFLREARRKPR
jgi:23S rRNA pseudouridine1911/1915/1917 synthase